MGEKQKHGQGFFFYMKTNDGGEVFGIVVVFWRCSNKMRRKRLQQHLLNGGCETQENICHSVLTDFVKDVNIFGKVRCNGISECRLESSRFGGWGSRDLEVLLQPPAPPADEGGQSVYTPLSSVSHYHPNWAQTCRHS